MSDRWDAVCQSLLVRAKQESERLSHHYLGTEHLALAMLADDGSHLRTLLTAQDADPAALEEAIRAEVQPSSVVKLQGFPLSPRVRKVVREAERLALADLLQSIQEYHLLLALLRAGRGVAARALERCGVRLRELDAALQRLVPQRGQDSARVAPEFGNTLPSALQGAMPAEPEADDSEAETKPGRLGSARQAPVDPAEAETRAGKPAGAVADPVAGETRAGARKEGKSKLGSARARAANAQAPAMPLSGNPVLVDLGVVKRPGPRTLTPNLDKLGRDLTELARQGRLGPIVGRDREIDELARSLCRAGRNNPLLMGEPGVGKTSIVEGLAIDVVQGSVPPPLLEVRIVEIPVAALTADTRYRGELEGRLMELIREASEFNTILVIDDVHLLVGGGKSDHAADAGSVLRPALARGDVRVIGVTTPRGFTTQMEKDAALVRCFNPIRIEEPSDEVVLEILKDAKARFESFHKVRIADDVLPAVITLTRGYLRERHMPDAAVDVLDEACVRGLRSGPAAPRTRSGRPTVKPADVAEVISQRTGIPVETLTVEEKARMAGMEEAIRKELVGQDDAVHRVCERIRMYKAGFREERRPLGVFLFLGPTGVGKTELARALARFLFQGGAEEHFYRFDMSEFMEGHEVSKLIGSPPGYVGFGEDGRLTGAVRRDPHCVVLLDEIEKAHPKVFDIFLQVFDDGRLTDGKGVATDFTHVLFILTSNLGADLWKGKKAIGIRQQGEADEEERRKRMTETLKGTFRLEFLNRLDDVLLFRPLEEAQIRAIALQMVERWRAKSARQGYDFTLADEALDFLCRKGFDREMGARPMKRAIEQHLMQPLSREILAGRLRAEAPVHAVLDGDTIRFEQEE